MIKAGLSPTRLRRKVLALCAEANYVGDLISELAHEARDQPDEIERGNAVVPSQLVCSPPANM